MAPEVASELQPEAGSIAYEDADLRTIHNHDFTLDYKDHLKSAKGLSPWQAHLVLWAARTAQAQSGDFIEVGPIESGLENTFFGTTDQPRRVWRHIPPPAVQIAFVHLTHHAGAPALTLETLWPTIVSGGLVLMGDYARYGHQPDKLALDSFAREHGVTIASLPTGQGLLIKP